MRADELPNKVSFRGFLDENFWASNSIEVFLEEDFDSRVIFADSSLHVASTLN